MRTGLTTTGSVDDNGAPLRPPLPSSPLPLPPPTPSTQEILAALCLVASLLFFVGACGYVASTLYARARAYREFDRQSELALGDLGRHEAVAVRKKRSRRVPLDDAETSEEAVRSKM